mgnify:CR=1 FL=1
MKKFWSIFTVALVALSAVSCSNNFDEVATIEGETLSFNVNIDNTRTALEQVENVWKTVWVGNETLVVSDGEKSYNFTNTTEDKNKFSCEAVGIRSLIGKNVTGWLTDATSISATIAYAYMSYCCILVSSKNKHTQKHSFCYR